MQLSFFYKGNNRTLIINQCFKVNYNDWFTMLLLLKAFINVRLILSFLIFEECNKYYPIINFPENIEEFRISDDYEHEWTVLHSISVCSKRVLYGAIIGALQVIHCRINVKVMTSCKSNFWIITNENYDLNLATQSGTLVHVCYPSHDVVHPEILVEM